MQKLKVNKIHFSLSNGQKYTVNLSAVVDLYFMGYVSFKKPMKLVILYQTNRLYIGHLEPTEIYILPTLDNIKTLYWLSENKMIDI